jgi:hypothetical protein
MMERYVKNIGKFRVFLIGFARGMLKILIPLIPIGLCARGVPEKGGIEELRAAKRSSGVL